MRRSRYALKIALARELRRNATPAERHAWRLLRNRGILGLKFRRQHVLRGFIVDFYCPELRLVLELEGAPHDAAEQAGYDAARARWLEACGYTVVRLRNRAVSREALQELLSNVLARRGRRNESPLSRQGEGDRGRGRTGPGARRPE